MRVITGSAKGMRLVTLEGNETRPTSERVKEAIFSAIQFELEGMKVLDLFAGSGQLGIEALSRGAESCVFVDSGRPATEVIKNNIEHVKMGAKSRVINSDAKLYVSTCRLKFDLILLDPPYHENMLDTLLPETSKLMEDNGIVFCETDVKTELPNAVNGLVLVKEYKHGKTKLWQYRYKNQ